MVRFCGLSSSATPSDLNSLSSGSDDDRIYNNNSPVSLNPFYAYDDGYEWPNLFEEVDDMMELSISIWPMTELRRRCRKNKVADPNIMKIPLDSRELATFLEDNVRLFGKFTADRSDRPRNDYCMQMLDALFYRKQRDEVTPHKFKIVYVNDGSKKEQVVYWMALDHYRRRLTLIFSWTGCSMDWVSEACMTEVQNPLHNSHASQSSTIKVHSGFLEPMFSSSKGGLNDFTSSEGLSEYKEILRNLVVPELKKYPGYKLYTCGHGMGAAIATLFAFQAASEPDVVVSKPVSCVSIGSPYVGDEAFRQAHQLLESLGKLRHLRLTNHKDTVTIMPKVSFRWNFFDKTSHVGTPFKHAGMNLRLYPHKTPVDISFPRARTGVVAGTLDEMARAWDNSFLTNLSWNPRDFFTFPHHPISEYNKRVTDNKTTLEIISLNDLYSRSDIVGNLVDER